MRVPQEKFSLVNWPMDAIGADAAIVPGYLIRDHIRFAVQLLSEGAPLRKRYTHLGWRNINNAWVYLHAGGAIGASGSVPDIDVSLAAPLNQFILPDPPDGEALQDAIRASLRVRDVASRAITVPLLAAVYRTIFGNTDFAIHLVGPTGRGKSALVALIQQHHGKTMHGKNLPDSWLSSAGAIEALAFLAKDTLLVVDDFAPANRPAEVQRMHDTAERVFRAQGNLAGRGRMRADSSLQTVKRPRGLILSTGEDLPRGQSVRARMLILEPTPEEVQWKTTLLQSQQDAAAGLYTQALAAYVHWLAPQYETLIQTMPARLATLRAQALQGGHKRTPEIIANLAYGWEMFLRFAREADVLSATEEQALMESGWEDLTTAARDQSRHQDAADPTRRFLELLIAALASGKAHLASPDGSFPRDAEAWGWRQQEGEWDNWRATGSRIGWTDKEDVYLQSDAAYACAQDLARTQSNTLALSPYALRQRLKEKGYLASWPESRTTVTVRRTLEKKRQEVLHLRMSLFTQDRTDSPAQNGAEAPQNGPQEGEWSYNWS